MGPWPITNFYVLESGWVALKDWYKMRVEGAERSGVQMGKVSAKWIRQWLDLGGRILGDFIFFFILLWISRIFYDEDIRLL